MSESEDAPNSGSWWATLPGILTALAGLATASGGLIIALDTVGWIGADKEQAEIVTKNTDPDDTFVSASPKQAAQEDLNNSSSQADAPPAEQPAKNGIGKIIRKDGTILPVYSESIRAHEGDEFWLLSGQRIHVNRIAQIDMLDESTSDGTVRVRIRLKNGTVVEDSVTASLRAFGIKGRNEVGSLTVSYLDIKSVVW
jgi:hypothetical protein